MHRLRFLLVPIVLAVIVKKTESFSTHPTFRSRWQSRTSFGSNVPRLYLSSEKADSADDDGDVVVLNSLTDEQKKEAVGNLVADDEWQGITMELSEVVRLAVLEDVKKNARDFLGKDDYKVGKFSYLRRRPVIVKRVDG
jgi:hypothetical protein